MEEQDTFEYNLLTRPPVGTGLSVVAALSFFVLCMMLPLVGPAGASQEHYAKNKAAFLSVLLVSLALSALASWSKLGRRRVDASPLPWFSFGLSAACVLALVVLQLGGFAI